MHIVILVWLSLFNCSLSIAVQLLLLVCLSKDMQQVLTEVDTQIIIKLSWCDGCIALVSSAHDYALAQ